MSEFKIVSSELEKVCGVKSSFPVNVEPEFAFAGRSNVGKSSFINMLMCRKSLARVSASPGKTRTVNYYLVNNKMYFVDLPGYGYTRASVEARSDWGRMVERYLRSSRSLKGIFLLVDIRHKPTADDVSMMNWIRSAGLVPAVIATKLDKLKKNEIVPALALIKNTLGLENDDVLIPVSSQTGAGKDKVYELISRLLIQEES